MIDDTLYVKGQRHLLTRLLCILLDRGLPEGYGGPILKLITTKLHSAGAAYNS